MSTCGFEGNAEMYGLGIRIGFYSQWYGTVLANWLAPSEAASLRKANTLFVMATFVALVIQRDSLEVVEIYIVLLLLLGSAFYFLPVLLWLLVTCCNPLYNSARFPRADPPGKLFNLLYTLLIVAVVSFTLWFWAARVPTLNGQSCVQNGFIFAKIRMDNYGFRIFHLVIGALLVVIVVVLLMLHFLLSNNRHRNWTPVFRVIDSVSKVAVAAVLNVAVEKTIAWNDIQGVHFADSASQTIPLVIGGAAVIRVIYVCFFEEDNENWGGVAALHTSTTSNHTGTAAPHTPPTHGSEPTESPTKKYGGMTGRYMLPV